ncbi:MAG TPA: protein kinase [Planctomycetota bacterium]|nr:protein kinase [Planctomycetota bacterium]
MAARIALVEDSEEVRRFARMLLSRKGFEVEEFPDGAAALDMVLTRPPDLVVSDVQMPRLDGLELTRKIRERYDKARLPIVLVSVMSEEEDIVRGFEAGANDYLVKPYRPAELLAKVSVLAKEGPYLRKPDEPLPPEPPPGEAQAEPKTESDTRLISLGAGSKSEVKYFFDKYEITGEYGRGGMGTVYRAVKRDDKRPVALKVLAPRLSESRTAIARFLREIKVLSELECDNVVKVWDHGYDNGRYFLAMEAVEGDALDRIVQREGPLGERMAGDIYAQAAHALQAIAEKGLVHRDVKPANILRRQDGLVKLVDFGLAKHEHDTSGLSESGYALGTPYYIAPEIIEGGKPDQRSDLFALGVTMFEGLTGRRPFTGVVPYQIFQLIVSGPRPDLYAARPTLSHALGIIVDKLLERDPRKRYQKASEVERDLREVEKRLT